MTSATIFDSGMFDLVGLIDRYGPVQASILQQLEIRDIIALSRVCKKLRHVYETTIKTQYDINKALKPFFASPVEFRNIQAETDAIISNTTALYFFVRRHCIKQMMIFVRRGSSTMKMQAYLEKDGWVGPEIPPPLEDCDELYHYEKHVHNCRQKEKSHPSCDCPHLALLSTCDSPLCAALLEPSVTEALNIITWSHAYSLLPYPTFILQRSFLLKNAADGSLDRLARLLKTKKRILDLPTEPLDIRDAQNCTVSEHQPVLTSLVDYGHRRIGDNHTWTIALNVDGIRQPTKPDMTTTHASFRFLPVFCPPPVEDHQGRLRFSPSHYKLSTHVVTAPCLKYEYLIDPTDCSHPAQFIVPRRYKDISLMQIEALQNDEKPPGWYVGDLDMSRLDHGWDEFGCAVPAGWKWYDDEVQGLLKARWN